MNNQTLNKTNIHQLLEATSNEFSIDVEKTEKKQRLLFIFTKVVSYTFLAIMAIIVLIPFYWMINTSLKSSAEIMYNYPPTLIPKKIMWENFSLVINSSYFYQNLSNTVMVGVISTSCTLCTTILGAFAFSRLSFKGRDGMFSLLLATMMIPGEMFVITNYITVSKFGWLNSYQVLIIPFVVSVFYIFLLRQSFKQIPDELYYAAKVDGTSDFKYLVKVMIPIAKSTIITVLILDLMGAWNSYIWPNLVNESEYRLISNWMRTAFNDVEGGMTQENLQMMASFVVTLPLFLVFVFARKFIMQGVSRSGIKG